MGASVEGIEVPLHRSLTEPLLLAGAPRGVAIVNGTVTAALALGLQIFSAGILFGIVAHTLAVFAAKRDPDFVFVLARHLRQRTWLGC